MEQMAEKVDAGKQIMFLSYLFFTSLRKIRVLGYLLVWQLQGANPCLLHLMSARDGGVSALTVS